MRFLSKDGPGGMPVWPAGLMLLLSLVSSLARGEVCTTQSQMSPVDRDAVAATVRKLAAQVQANDAAGLRAETVPEYAKDFAAMGGLVASAAPKVAGAQFSVDQLYVLDATNLKTLGDGTNQDAQFFCTLNKSSSEVDFLVPALPPGRYAFGVATAEGAKSPWRLSFLLRQAVNAPGQWLMAGFYPKQLTAAGHDGLWYWTQARTLVKEREPWTAYLYYQEAQSLLQPVGFLVSTHLEKLRKEETAGAPPALSEGISADAPLVVKGPQASEFRFTALTTDDSLGGDKIDVVVHLAPEPAAADASSFGGSGKKETGKKEAGKDSAPVLSPRERNDHAMAALVAAFPELRANFHGVWVFADQPGKNAFVTEQPMASIH